MSRRPAPTNSDNALTRGRHAFERHRWSDAHAELSSAAATGALDPGDLRRLALAAQLIGRHDEASELLARAYQEALQAGDLPRAARNAFWLGFGLIHRGEFARGGGWVSRAARMLEEADLDCVERGYVLLPGAIRASDEGDPATAYAEFERVSEIAARFGDVDLATLGRLGRGTSMVDLGERGPGVDLLDEAMVAVTAGEVSPVVAGIVYCATIEACQRLFDLRRAQEWTTALARWCDSQPDMIPFRGRCMLYRAELMRLHGAWRDAVEEVRSAYARLSAPPPEPAVGEALYEQAELHRLRGEFDAAESEYREASQWGRPPEPGFGQLRLAQGDVGGAHGIISRALAETRNPTTRIRLLEPAVEIALAAGDVRTARQAADELAGQAEAVGAPLVRAMAWRAEGAVLLAEGEGAAALVSLRRALATWQALEAPYEAARTRVLVGLACRSLGDDDTANLEFDAARAVFRELGAVPDSTRVDALGAARSTRIDTPGTALTPREIEVLRLVAAGKTNRAIADELVISEKTVARHVANIFTKLDLSSRSAATAWAYEHGLQRPAT